MALTLDYSVFHDKVRACWLGKNIGGTLGAPYEGTTSYLDVKGYKTPKGEPLPNDDLDLQLVWLMAAEEEGLYKLDAKVLGEYWLSYITPHWNEYGIGKANMRSGLQPPLSGDQDNDWKNSNGAWIRSEIWASLFPGRPDIAATYALEDASVDHGTGEGVYAAIFTAALQSAAYVLADVRDCMAVALSKIPADCRVAQSVLLARRCHEEGLPARETRDKIQQANADLGTGWFEAPSNIGYVVLGLLYGNGDFKSSMLHAVNCGDDTDCTAATVGATLGILGGTAAIPTDWREYIGDKIVTISICRALCWKLPATCGELTERVVRLAQAASTMPSESRHYHVPLEVVEISEHPSSTPQPPQAEILDEMKRCPFLRERLAELLPYSVKDDFTFAHAVLAIEGGVRLAPGEEMKLHLVVAANTNRLGNIPYIIRFRFWLPGGVTVEGPASAFLPVVERHTNGKAEADFTLKTTSGVPIAQPARVVLEITADGRAEAGYLSFALL